MTVGLCKSMTMTGYPNCDILAAHHFDYVGKRPFLTLFENNRLGHMSYSRLQKEKTQKK